MIISNWLEKEEQENPTELLCNFKVYGGVMEDWIFKGSKDTVINADGYIQACVGFVDNLVDRGFLIIDDLNDYMFIELYKKDDPNEIEVNAKEKPHACTLYVKTMVDRGMLFVKMKE